ncbi:BatD family protein [Legionella worsleiensis]|uniref:KQDN repeat-containing protein n=1 Tax=Legionella worsleiensis TaxID=45076 RepID=A0A0W1AER7_9GAMM|nr:BatD family protein [Legionella worsleiensis]KTD79825.1 KQDN repeat-containing protein [Legionella worsleiensis]STY32336.1 KQDN repeat-containing protein [Legionella worsleiensis]
MKKIITLLILWSYALISCAEIQVEVQPSQVAMGDVFKLIITDDNPQNGGVPDLTALQKEFSIYGTERHVNYTLINGQAQTASQWIISLKPLKPGILTIPAIKLGMNKSNPITINVDDNQSNQDFPQNTGQQQDVVLTADVNEKTPFVNQQITYTVKLYNSKRLLDAQYQGPQVDNALLIPLGDAKRYQTIQNTINYVVEEQNYAVFPQKSGTLKISSPTFTALVYDFNSQRVKVRDKPIELNVQPVPAQYKGKLWLPAKQVKLTEDYENTSQILEQGSTLTRTVRLEGVAIPAQLLPTLDFKETDEFSVYPEKGADKNQVKQGELVGSTEFKVTYLFNKAGKTTIPELRLHWFNTTTKKDEVAVLAPRSLEITPSLSTSTEKTPPRNNEVKQVKPLTQPVPDSNLSSSINWAWGIAALFACAWMVTLGLWLWQKNYPFSTKKHMKHALTQLDKACVECNPKKARDALLKWGRLQWPDAPMLNLSDLTKLISDPHLKKQIHLLSQVLYQSSERTLWRGDELLRAVMAFKRSSTAKKRNTNALPPINPF